MTVVRRVLDKLELKDGGEEATFLRNKDIQPVPVEERNWNFWDFCSFYSIPNVAIGTWAAGGSMLDLGLNIKETVGCVVLANVIISLFYYGVGAPGNEYHIGYTIMNRMVFGVRGFYIGVILRILLSIVEYAKGCWMGGLVINTILASWSKSYLNMKNTFPDSTGMTSQGLCGFVLFQVVNVPLLLFVKPSHSKFVLHVGVVLCFFSMVGLCAWAVATNHGSNGPLMDVNQKLTTTQHAWAWINGITSWYGSITPGIINSADYSRHRSPKCGKRWVFLSGFVGNLVMGTIIPFLGIITISACYEQYGTEYWYPQKILTRILQDNYTPKARAGVFFCAMGIFASQLASNLCLNGICGGIDLAGFFPKYISIKRGSLFIALISWAVCPWYFYSSSSTFLAVITSFSVFLCPLLGIMMCEYFIKKRRRIKLSDLYSYEPTGSYYAYKGFNIKNLVAWILGFWPGIPGMANAVTPNVKVAQGWVYFYYGNVIFGCAISVFCCYVFGLIWPDGDDKAVLDEQDYYNTFTVEECEKLGIAPYEGPNETVLESVQIDNSSNEPDEKNSEKV